MKNWCEELFGTRKPILAMCHCYPMPSDPNYNEKNGVDWIVEKALHDVTALQEGGVDGIIFSNERSQPWTTKARPVVTATMAGIIGEVKRHLKVPFGVDVIWDPMPPLIWLRQPAPSMCARCSPAHTPAITAFGTPA